MRRSKNFQIFQIQYFLGPNNMPYCETHYNQLYGDVCIICNLVIQVNTYPKSHHLRVVWDLYSCSGHFIWKIFVAIKVSRIESFKDEVISALEKRYCDLHFECHGCQQKLDLKKKFVEFDMKPLCTKCFDKFPSELKKRIKKNNSKKF